ncbi:carbohydrate-binding module family 50 protein, partial [Aureobasidium melanogenum]
MKSTVYPLTILAGFLASTKATPVPVDISSANLKECCDQWHGPRSYTCRVGADSNALCPVVNGEAMDDCNGACYTPLRYSCNGTALAENPRKTSGTFTLTASNPDQAFDGQPIQAAGNHFWVGGHAATYCPTSVGSICNSFPNDTTLIGNGYMATVVPGGQDIYWQTDGAMAFTQAHSSSQWNLSYYGGGIAYEGGGYFGPNGEDLITCPVTPGGSNTTAWKLFARLSGVEFSSSCVGLNLAISIQQQPSASSGKQIVEESAQKDQGRAHPQIEQKLPTYVSLQTMSSRTSSTTAQSSTLRPRAPRLISGLDDEAPATLTPIARHASPLPSPFDSREPSPMPSTRLPRTASSQTVRPVKSMSRLNPDRAQSPATLSAFFGDSWSAIQGMASDLLTPSPVSSKAALSPRRRKPSITSTSTRNTSAPPKQWGVPTSTPSSAIGLGSYEERESLIRAEKRKQLMNATPEHNTIGHFKRRSSEDGA